MLIEFTQNLKLNLMIECTFLLQNIFHDKKKMNSKLVWSVLYSTIYIKYFLLLQLVSGKKFFCLEITIILKLDSVEINS